MVFWRLKCVSPGFAGPFRLWLRRTCLLRYAASCPYRVCVYVMARCCASYGLIPSDLAVFRPCALMLDSAPAVVCLRSGSVS